MEQLTFIRYPEIPGDLKSLLALMGEKGMLKIEKTMDKASGIPGRTYTSLSILPNFRLKVNNHIIASIVVPTSAREEPIEPHRIKEDSPKSRVVFGSLYQYNSNSLATVPFFTMTSEGSGQRFIFQANSPTRNISLSQGITLSSVIKKAQTDEAAATAEAESLMEKIRKMRNKTVLPSPGVTMPVPPELHLSEAGVKEEINELKAEIAKLKEQLSAHVTVHDHEPEKPIRQIPSWLSQYYKPSQHMVAVGHDPSGLRFIHQQTDEVCLEAVKISGDALQYVHKQTPEICRAAINSMPESIKWVIDQTPDLVNLAFKDRSMVEFIRADSMHFDPVKHLLRDTDHYKINDVFASMLFEQPWDRKLQDLVNRTLCENGSIFARIPNKYRTDSTIRAVIKNNLRAVAEINKHTSDIKTYAIQQSHTALWYLRDLTDDDYNFAYEVHRDNVARLDTTAPSTNTILKEFVASFDLMALSDDNYNDIMTNVVSKIR